MLDAYNMASMNPKETLLYLLSVGLNQSQIAKAIGVSRTSIHHAVKTDNWKPSYVTAQKLECLKASVDIGGIDGRV